MTIIPGAFYEKNERRTSINSPIIGPEWEIIEKQDYFEEKIIKGRVILYSGDTIFSKYGNWPLTLILVLYLSLIVINRVFKKNLSI